MKRQLLAEQRVDARKGANNQAQEAKDGKGPIFKIYQNAKRVGTQIKEDLLRDGTYIIDKGDFYDFMLTDTSVESGVLDYAYGTFMFLKIPCPQKRTGVTNETIQDLLKKVKRERRIDTKSIGGSVLKQT